jgi:hypothetical protein
LSKKNKERSMGLPVFRIYNKGAVIEIACHGHTADTTGSGTEYRESRSKLM